MTVIGLDDNFVYWNNESVGANKGLLERALKDGSNVQTVASGITEGPWTFAVGPTSVAFVAVPRFGGSGQVATIPSAGGMPSAVSTFAGTASSARVAVSGSYIAWATTDNGGSVLARTVAGVVVLASGQGEIGALTARPTGVYWVRGPAGGPRSLARAPWTGGAQSLFDGIANPGPMTVNATHVYFVDNRLGEIKRVPK
jgi:hypothetical protein